MNGRESVIDGLPPWMLVESTGDSEVDAVIGRDTNCDEDDDAESCICDKSEDFDPDCSRELRRWSDEIDAEDQEDDKAPPPPPQTKSQSQPEQEEVRSYRRNCGAGGVEEKGVPILCHKSSASIDSTEDEKNRLFWEACLAS